MDADELNTSGQTCVTCGIKSPPTETNYTLISSRHGWRLSLETHPDGRREAIWRCPKCWHNFRKQNAAR